MPKLQTVNVQNVEVLAEGTWNGDPYDGDDLDAMVAAFDAGNAGIDPPVKLGHTGDQKLLQADGLPAAGYVSAVRHLGSKLVVDLRDVPKKIADLINAKAYSKVSAEVFFNLKPPEGGKRMSRVLSGIALLGADVPAVGTIADIEALYGAKFEAIAAHYGLDRGELHVTYAADANKPDDGDGDEDYAQTLAQFLERMDGRMKGSKGMPAMRTFVKEMMAKVNSMKPKSAAYAVWTTAYVDNLPDSAFLYIEDGGQKDADGKTTPRSLRHFPYRDAGRQVDEAHLRDALGRIPQSDLPAAVKQQVAGKARAIAQREGIGSKENAMDRDVLVKLLGLDADADDATVETAVKKLQADATRTATYADEVTKLNDRVGELSGRLAAQDAEAAVEDAFRQGKLLPAQREWAKSYALKDPTGFAAYAEKTPKFPLLGVKGSDDDPNKPVGVEDLTPDAEKIAAQLGISTEKYAETATKLSRR